MTRYQKTRGDSPASEFAGLEGAGSRRLMEAMDTGLQKTADIRKATDFDGRAIHNYLQRLMARGLVRRLGTYERREWKLTEHGKRYLWAMRVLTGDALPGKLIRPYPLRGKNEQEMDGW